MKPRRPYALVDIHWLPLPATLKYPTTSGFGLTGYREQDGAGGLFSVYVKTLTGEPGAGATQSAKIYALVEEMCGRLPEIGGKFLLSTGMTVTPSVKRCSPST